MEESRGKYPMNTVLLVIPVALVVAPFRGCVCVEVATLLNKQWDLTQIESNVKKKKTQTTSPLQKISHVYV